MIGDVEEEVKKKHIAIPPGVYILTFCPFIPSQFFSAFHFLTEIFFTAFLDNLAELARIKIH